MNRSHQIAEVASPSGRLSSSRASAWAAVLACASLLPVSAWALPGAQTRSADGYVEVSRFGYPNTRVCRGVDSAEELMQFVADDPGVYRQILAAAGFPGDADDVLAAIADGGAYGRMFPSGTEFQWMGIRRDGSGAVTEMVRFTGSGGFSGYALDVRSGETDFRFVIPSSCCNLALVSSTPAPAPPPPAPPMLSLSTSGPYSHATARVTVDARVREGSSLTVTLRRPSGGSEVLQMSRDGHRYTWTGPFNDAGAYTVEAVVDGPEQERQAVSESVTLSAGEPTCSVTLAASQTPVAIGMAEMTVNACDSMATTGQISTRYARILRDGVQVASMDLSGTCERTLALPGEGDYEAVATAVDDRGVEASCNGALGIDVEHPRVWPTLDIAGGIHRSNRPDLIPQEPTNSGLGGAVLGFAVPHSPGSESTTMFLGRAGGGVAHRGWFGSLIETAIERHISGGFFGLGAGLWGLGDSDITDVAISARGGFDLPLWTRAGQAQFFFEGRVFATEISEFQDNYVGLVGIRFQFTPQSKLRAR